MKGAEYFKGRRVEGRRDRIVKGHAMYRTTNALVDGIGSFSTGSKLVSNANVKVGTAHGFGRNPIVHAFLSWWWQCHP